MKKKSTKAEKNKEKVSQEETLQDQSSTNENESNEEQDMLKMIQNLLILFSRNVISIFDFTVNSRISVAEQRRKGWIYCKTPART
jgi:hypothetical protein